MSDMLKLLKIFDNSEKPTINEAVSLSINATGESSNDVTDMLSKIIQLSGMKPVTPDMMPSKDTDSLLPSMKTIHDINKFADEEITGGYDSTSTKLDHDTVDDPGEIDDVTMATAGGLNRPHKQYKKEYPGDNPMSLEEEIAKKLMTEYKKLIENQDTQEKAADMKDDNRLDELSPATLKSYAKKASSSTHPTSASNLASKAGYEFGQSGDDDHTAGEKYDKKSVKRSNFIGKAIDKLSK